jgi:hypothetical protein
VPALTRIPILFVCRLRVRTFITDPSAAPPVADLESSSAPSRCAGQHDNRHVPLLVLPD